eukprot:6179838-Pleurochrysis_carterae.AAC.1
MRRLALGTVASAYAKRSFEPCRMMPPCSCARPNARRQAQRALDTRTHAIETRGTLFKLPRGLKRHAEQSCTAEATANSDGACPHATSDAPRLHAGC